VAHETQDYGPVLCEAVVDYAVLSLTWSGDDQVARASRPSTVWLDGVRHREGVCRSMSLELNKREASQLLAALRNWQEEMKSVDIADYFEAYFEEHEPLSSDEIDELCKRIATSAGE
jgi:hypothetical protein